MHSLIVFNVLKGSDGVVFPPGPLLKTHPAKPFKVAKGMESQEDILVQICMDACSGNYFVAAKLLKGTEGNNEIQPVLRQGPTVW